MQKRCVSQKRKFHQSCLRHIFMFYERRNIPAAFVPSWRSYFVTSPLSMRDIAQMFLRQPAARRLALTCRCRSGYPYRRRYLRCCVGFLRKTFSTASLRTLLTPSFHATQCCFSFVMPFKMRIDSMLALDQAFLYLTKSLQSSSAVDLLYTSTNRCWQREHRAWSVGF
jgi:hypothetical protein